MTSRAQEVKNSLNSLLMFFEPLRSLANSHFTCIFTENAWETCVPGELQEELRSNESKDELMKIYSEILKTKEGSTKFVEKYPSLANFLHKAKSLSISDDKKYLTSLSELQNLLLSNASIQNCDFKLTEFMSKKKLHEVRVTSEITAFLSRITNSSHVIDVGGGKGYLSSLLVLQHNCKVLGVDSSQMRSCGAIKRSEKVAQLWKDGVFADGRIGQPRSCDKKFKKSYLKDRYKMSVVFVTPETDVRNIVREEFEEDIDGMTMTGLHTCGDLASTCLKLFNRNRELTAVVNVGCCYHHLSEEFSAGEVPVSSYGFPMSNYLREKNFFLGRNARMLASYSLDRMLTQTDLEGSSPTSLFYRSLLETVIRGNEGPTPCTGRIGKIARKCNSFHEYMVKAVGLLNLNVEVTEKYSADLYARYEDKKPIFNALYLLRISLAPVVESIVLLDRFLYLLENGIDNVYLVRLFDLEISPRGFGLVAWKG